MTRPARIALFVSTFALAAASLVQAQSRPAEDLAARAKRIHAEAIVLDTHIDTTQRLLQPGWSFFDRHEPNAPGRRGPGARGNHVDYPRMREGGLDGLFFSIYCPVTEVR